VKNRVSGVLLVDKPAGMTSFSVVSRIKRAAGVKKVGHTGTLDPMATGLLPLVLGRATKLVPFIQAGPKEYTGRFVLGITTDTDDITGRVITRKTGFDISHDDITKTAREFVGAIEQMPPQYSAVKVGGRPAYKLARRGEKVDIRARRVVVTDLTITGFDLPLVSFRVRVSKGTYIRSLAADIGRRLNTGACLESLRRISSAPFSIQEAVSLENALDMARAGRIEELVIPMEKALGFMPEVAVSEEFEKMVRNGRPLPMDSLEGFRPQSGPVRVLAPEKGLLAIYEYIPDDQNPEQKYLIPVRVLAAGEI
jgi:tRNA pseudouridine55 synthase